MVMMNNAFDRIAPVIYKNEGTIARLLGNSLLAFFGTPWHTRMTHNERCGQDWKSST